LWREVIVKVDLIGVLNRPAILIIGSWDPFVAAHRRLISQLVGNAAKRRYNSVVVLLHPHPAAYLSGLHNWPTYDDIGARVEFLKELCVDAAVVVHFSKSDLNRGFKELFELLIPHVDVAELWLKAGQSLGRDDKGSRETIARITAEHRIRLIRLDRQRGLSRVRLVRRAIEQGCLRKAAVIAGHPAILERPACGQIRLAWPSGEYSVGPVIQPSLRYGMGTFENSSVVEMQLDTREGRMGIGCWPDEFFKWIAVLSGPGDFRPPPRSSCHSPA
jgi:hypothetical protein